MTANLHSRDREAWAAAAAALSIEGRSFIDGRLVDAASGRTFERIKPRAIAAA